MSGHSPGTWIHVTLNSMFQRNDSFRYRLKESHKSRPFLNPLVGTSGRWVIAKQGHLCHGSHIILWHFNFGAVGRAYPVDIFQVELSESHKAI